MQIFMKLLVAASLVLGTMAFAGETLTQEEPDVLVKRVTQEVMEAAKIDKDIKAGNRERIQALVKSKILPHVDFERTTAMTVGRHWHAATMQQKARLTDEFCSLLIHTYANALSQLSDQKLEFKPLRADPADTDVEVRFQVLQARGGEPIQLSYRLHKTAQGWKVYDVNLLGAWLIETYKNSFSAEINKGGLDALIHTLEQKNRKLTGQAAGTKKAL